MKLINYIKSENYRLLHSKSIYLYTIICATLIILAAFTLVYFDKTTFKFPYANLKFFLVNIVSSGLFIIAIGSAMNLIVNNKENKNIVKQSISFDISLDTIYYGKFIIFLFYFFILCLICTIVSILFGSLLFEKDYKTLNNFIISLINMSPLIFGALALSHLLNSLKINGAFSVLLTIFIYYYGGGLLELLKFINKKWIILYNYSPTKFFEKIFHEYATDTSVIHLECWMVGIGLGVVFLIIGNLIIKKTRYLN